MTLKILISLCLIILSASLSPAPEGIIKRNKCPSIRKKACTREYIPVCGWFKKSVPCLSYPCGKTYGNKCTACSDVNVDYYTKGPCPKFPRRIGTAV